MASAPHSLVDHRADEMSFRDAVLVTCSGLGPFVLARTEHGIFGFSAWDEDKKDLFRNGSHIK